MSGRKKGKGLDAGLPERADYEVGYGKPPEATRFRPGQSGNPRGRPKGAKNKQPKLNEERLKDIILEEAYRSIKVRDGEKNVTVPIAQAVMRSLAVNAAKGHHRSQKLFAELLGTTERSNKALHDEWLETAINYEVEWERELDRRRRLGITEPDPIPHPDHIEIDFRTGEVIIKGPMSKEQQAQWDRWRSMRREMRAEIEENRALLEEDDTTAGMRKIIESDIAHNERIIALIGKVVGEEDSDSTG